VEKGKSAESAISGLNPKKFSLENLYLTFKAPDRQKRASFWDFFFSAICHWHFL
jgi:hypothetical protein